MTQSNTQRLQSSKSLCAILGRNFHRLALEIVFSLQLLSPSNCATHVNHFNLMIPLSS